jgi:hypothetical protein
MRGLAILATAGMVSCGSVWGQSADLKYCKTLPAVSCQVLGVTSETTGTAHLHYCKNRMLMDKFFFIRTLAGYPNNTASDGNFVITFLRSGTATDIELDPLSACSNPDLTPAQ